MVELEKQLDTKVGEDSSKTSKQCSWKRHGRSNHITSMTRKGNYCEMKSIFARDGCDSSACC